MKYLKNEELAKDSTQQIFEKCTLELQKYSVDYFKSWLYKITQNYCFMQLRKHPSKNIIDIETVSYQLKDTTDNEELNILELKNTTIEVMLQSLKELNKEQEQCVTLFYLEKKSYQEIAENLLFAGKKFYTKWET
jgi:RNA polymerase sigma factor (sigma-70 family)